MERSKKVIFTSHCILNQNTVVCPLARAKGGYREVIQELMDNEIGIHQLPCPEYRHLGLKREPMSKNQYDTPEYRELCKNISKDAINIMKEYLNNDYEIAGLMGIYRSPTCSIKDVRGIFMEELLDLVEKEGIHLKTIDIPTDYVDVNNNKGFIGKLREMIKN